MKTRTHSAKNPSFPARLRLLGKTARASALATLISVPTLHAASGTWNLDANGSWGVGTNWTGGIPGAIDELAAFTNDISAARTITLDGSRTVGTLQIGDPNSTHAFTLTAVPTGGALTFDVSAGSALLNFSSAAAIANTITVPLILNDNLRVAITGASTGTHVLNGPISGAQSVAFDANGQAALNALGQVTLNGVNTFSGGLSTTQVRVTAPNAFSLGTGTATVNNTGQIFATATGTYNNNLVLTGLGWQESTGLLGALRSDVSNTFNGNITVQQAGAALTTRFNTHTTGTITNVINGVVSGNANVEFTKSNAAGTSTWVLANNATYTGPTLIGFNAGGTGSSVLQLGNAGTTGSLLAASAVTINSGGVLGFNRSNAFTFTNTVTGAGGVTNSGVGTITWDNTTSGYTGATVVSGANDAARLVFGSGGAYTFSGGAAAITLSNGADLEYRTSSAVNLSGVITGATNSHLMQGGSGTLTVSGSTDNPNARAIVSNGILVLGKTSGSTVHALTAANDVALFVNGGTARLGGTGGDQIATNSDVMVNAGGTLDLNAQSEGFDALGGNGGTIRNGIAATTSALTLGESNSGVNIANPLGSTTSYAGIIQDGAGTVLVVKTGTGLQTFSGANTYTGGTNVNGGALSVTGTLSLTSPVAVNTGGTLAGTGFVGNVTMAAGGALRPGATLANTDIGTLTTTSLVVNGGDLALNVGDLVSVTGTANFAGASTVSPTFSAPPVLGNVALVNALGGLTVGVAPTLNGVPATTRSTFGITNTASLLLLSVTGASAESLTWSGTTNGNWNLNTTANFNAGAQNFFNLDGVTFGDGPANRTITLSAGLNPSVVTVNASTGNDYIFQTGTLVGGGTGINKSNGGLLTVNTANTFGGNVNITGGTLRAGNATALGDAVGVTNVSGGGTLDVGGQNLGAEIVRISGTGVGGNGAIINNGAGSNNAFRFITLTGHATIGGANRYDIRANGGGEILDLGGFTLTKTGAGQFSIVGIPVVTNGSMTANQGIFSIETTSVIQGTGTITYNAGSTAQFFQSVAANITRPMVWNGNFVDPAGQTNGVGSNVTMTGDATLQGTGTLTFTGNIAESVGGRSIVKNNTSTYNLQGNVSYTGATTVNGGTLTIGNGQATSLPNTSAISLTGGGLLQYFVNGNATLPAVSIAASGGTFRWVGGTQGSTATVNTTYGASQTAGALSVQQGTLTLASGANVTVANVDVGRTSQNTNNIGTLNIQPGSLLTIGNTFYIGESAAGLTGIVNQTGGDVFVNGTDNGVDGSFRIGHWSGLGSTYNISAGTLTALNGNTSIGIDGVQPSLNISGTAQVTFKRLYVDGRGITAPSAYLRMSSGLLALGDGGISSNPSAGAGTNSSNVTISGGTLRSIAAANLTPVWSVGMSFDNNTPIIDIPAGSVSMTGAVEGPGGFTKIGNGTLTLSNAANNFNGVLNANGGTTVLSGTMNGAGSLVVNSGGTLVVNGSQPAGNTAVVNSGGTLGGSGSVGNLTVNPGGIVLPGNSIGTLTAAALDFAGNARFELTAGDFSIGGASNDLINVSGGLTLNGGSVTPIWDASPTAGIYTLMTSAGVTTNTLPTVNAGASRQTYTVGVNGNNVELTVAGSVANLIWNGTLNGNAWDVNNTANWQATLPNDEKFFTADNVTFDGTGSNSPDINLTTSLLPGSTTVSGNTNYTFAGSGGINAGSLTKSGSGTLVLATNNSYPGPTTITGGVLQIGAGGATGSIGGGAITNDATFIINRSGVVSFPNVIGGAGSLVLAGGGSFTLSAGNSHGGGTTISAGSLLITNVNGAGFGTVTLGDGATGASSTSFFTTNNLNPSNDVTVSASGTGTATIGTLLGGAAGSTFFGTLTLNRATTLQGQDTNFTGYSGQITGPVGTLTIAGGGRTIFQNTGNDFVGDIVLSDANTILQSALAGGASETIPNGSSITVNAGTTFNIGFASAGTETINALNGAGTVQLSNAGAFGTTRTLALGSADGTGSFSGIVQNGTGAVPFALTKLGTGTQAMNGAVNSTGSITVTGGVFSFGNAFGAGATKAALTTDATLDNILTLTGVTTNDLVIGMSVTGTGVPAGSRIVTIPSTTTVTIAGLQTATLAGNLTFGAAPMFVSNAATFRYTGAARTDDRLINLDVTSGTLEASGTGALTLSGTPLQYTGGAGARTLTLGGTSTAANTLAAVINDSGGATNLVKNGTGTWVVTGAGGNYTGGAVINAGVLRIGTNNRALGDAFAVSIANGATLDFNAQTGNAATRRYDLTVSGPGVAGQAAIWNGGAGVTNNPLYRSVTLTGDTSIGTNSRYDINGGTVDGTGVTFNGGTFTLTKVGTGETWWSPNGGATVGSIIVNGGIFGVQSSFNLGDASFPISINPAGTLYTFSNVTNDKPIVISGGILGANNATGTWTNSVTLNGAGTTNRVGPLIGTQVTLQGQVTGNGFEKIQPGTVELQNPSNDWTGETKVSAGTVRVNGGGVLSTATTLDMNGGTVDVNFSIQEVAGLKGATGTITGSGTLTVNQAATTIYGGAITSPMSIVKDDIGTLTLTGALSFAQLDVNDGRLNLNSTLPGATINDNNGILNVNADANNSTVNVSATTVFTVSQTLNSLTINAGGTATLGGPAAAPALFDDGFAADAIAPAATAAVPEPGSLSLLALGALGFLSRRRRKL